MSSIAIEDSEHHPISTYDRYWSDLETPWSQKEKQGRQTKPRIEFFMGHFISAKTGRETNWLALNRHFQNVNEWDEDKIRARGESLFQSALRIWNGPDAVGAEAAKPAETTTA